MIIRTLTSSLLLVALMSSRGQEIEVPRAQPPAKVPTRITASSSDVEVRLYATRFANRQRGDLLREMGAFVGYATRKFDLDEVHLRGLKTLADLSVDSAMEKLIDRVVAAIEKAGLKQTPAILTRAATAAASESISARSQTVWLEGIHEWLSAEQCSQIEMEFEFRQERRVAAMRQALFFYIDEELCFRPGQWEIVAPKIAPAVEALLQLRDNRQTNLASAIQRSLRELKLDAAGKGLDPHQRQLLKNIQSGEDQRWRPSSQAIQWIKSQPPPEDGAKTEELLSVFLEGCYENRVQRHQVEVETQVAQLDRVVQLSAEQQDDFRWIGRGVIQDGLEQVRPMLARWIRTATRNAPPSTLGKRIVVLTAPSYTVKLSIKHSAPWRLGMKTILIDSQQELWEAEESRRKEVRRMAQVEMMIDEIDRQVQLDSSQIEGVKGLLIGVLERYEPDIEKALRNRLWCLQVIGLQLPWAGVDKISLEAALEEEQYLSFQKMLSGNLERQWQSIQKLHDQRIGESTPQS